MDHALKKDGENMQENSLKSIGEKKIRRQYFNAPLIFLYSAMIAIPYFILVISLGIEKFDASDWPSTLWISIWVSFFFSIPVLILRAMCKHLFGRIICVINEEGIHYASKGKLLWETIEKIEYVIDSKPRYKTDTKKPFRTIIYTKGGKIITLDHAPMHIISCIKKYSRGLDVKVSGAASLFPVVLIMAAIILLCPPYVVLLVNSPGGVSMAHVIVLLIIWSVLGIIRTPVFDAYSIRYRFWRRILPRKWLSYIILGCYYSSFFAALLVLFYFPNWAVVALLGIYLGIVQPPVPSRHGSSRFRTLLSYEQLYDVYINQADFWEKELEKNKAKRTRR